MTFLSQSIELTSDNLNDNTSEKKWIRLKADGIIMFFFLISEIKTDSSFAVVQFHIEGYIIPYRLDRYINGGGFLLYIREDIPSSLINFDVTIEDFSVET